MKLKAPTVSDPAAQLNFEQVAKLFDTLLSVVNGSGVKVNWGTVSVTWSASAYSNAPTVQHGLGKTPAVVFTQPLGDTDILSSAPQSIGLATFAVQAKYSSAISGAASLFWLAIG